MIEEQQSDKQLEAGNSPSDDPNDSVRSAESPEPDPKVSPDRFGYDTKSSERTGRHILTIRKVAKMFEQRGAPVTERTILNWCHPNKRGEYRLDCYFDTVDSKYYITPASVQTTIGKQPFQFTDPNISEELPI